MKYLLICTDRMGLNIDSAEFNTPKAAHDQMLAEILAESNYANEKELIDAANAGEAGYSDDEAWIHHATCDTIVWKIIAVATETKDDRNCMRVKDLKSILEKEYDDNAEVIIVDWSTGHTYEASVGSDDEDEGTKYCRICLA